jgi:hypothetical protein
MYHFSVNAQFLFTIVGVLNQYLEKLFFMGYYLFDER